MFDSNKRKIFGSINKMGELPLSLCLACEENIWVLSTSHGSPFCDVQLISRQNLHCAETWIKHVRKVLLAQNN
jgi:hypothetical protein